MRRFWAVYNVVLFVAIVGFGVVMVLTGDTRGVVGGVVLVGVGGLLLARQVVAVRGRPDVAARQVNQVEVVDSGVRVLWGDVESPGQAWLAWDDCAAVVASRAANADRLYYVRVLPVADDRVVLVDVPRQLLRAKAAVADIPATAAAALVWVVREGDLRVLADVLDQIRVHRPGLRVVDSIAGRT